MPKYLIRNNTAAQLYIPPPVDVTIPSRGSTVVLVAAADMENPSIKSMVQRRLVTFTASDDGSLSDDVEVPTLSMVTGGHVPVGPAGGDLTGFYPNPDIAPNVVGPNELIATGVAPGVYGSGTQIPVVTVDADGRVTGASQAPVSLAGGTDKLVLTPGPVQTISANTDAFTPTTSLHRFTVVGGNHALTSTPTIPTAGVAPGTVLILQNLPTSAFHVQLQRGAAQALSLSNANTTIDPGGNMTLVFDGTLWVELTHNPSTST